MKNVMKKLAGLLMVLSVALFAGCSDSSDRANEAPQTAKTYTVSGKISIGNAVPAGLAKSLANSFTAANSNARTATTDFDMNKITCGSTKWEVKATNASGEIYGEVKSEEMLYSINLPTGTWDLKLSLLGETDTNTFEALLYYEEKELKVPGDSGAGPDIFLSPKNFSTNINGALDLTITDGTTGSKIKSVICNLEYLTREDSADFPMDENFKGKLATVIASLKKPEDFSSGSVTIKQDGIPAGSYEATFTFKDAKDNTLYECKEIITVFSGWTTDTWLGEGAHLKKNTEGKIEFRIEDIFEVENVPDTQMVLYEATDGTYKYCLSDTASSTVPETTEYSSSSNRFAFDSNGNFYCMDGFKVISNNTKANEKEITIDSDFSGNDIQYFAIDRATDALYVYAYKSDYNSETHSYDDTGKLYKFPKLVSDGSVDDKITFEDSTYELSTSLFVVNNGTLYAVSLGESGHPLYKADVSAAAGGSLNLSQIAALTDIPEESVEITDMLYQDECLYILFRQSHLGFDNDGLSSNTIYARGAVVKVNLFNNQTELCGWTSDYADVEHKYLYAFKSYNDADTIYYYDVGGETVNIVTTVGEMGTGSNLGFGKDRFFTPDISDSLSQEAFYAPKKFIALMPKKLVIADNGVAFYTDANDALRYKKVSRVVTVDLESFAIENTEDASVKFDEGNPASLLFIACMCQNSFNSSKLYRSDDKTTVENGTVVNYKDYNSVEKTETISTDLKFFGIPQ